MLRLSGHLLYHGPYNMLGLPRGTVRVVPSAIAWPRLFETEAEALRDALGDRGGPVEHVGSTAVPGLAAKPILDMMVAVPSMESARALVGAVERLGYTHRPNGDAADRVFFAKGPTDRRTHHLSLTTVGSGFWRAHVAFRDRLREDPEFARAYEALKRSLAEAHPEDRGAYTAGKEAFVAAALRTIGV